MKIRRGEDVRKVEILDAALKLAANVGYKHITREALAEEAKCSTGLVTRYFGTMVQLRRAIVSAAITRQDLTVIAQGITAKEPKALGINDDLKLRALEHAFAGGRP